MSDLNEQIAELETEIENLSWAAERCGRMMLAAKVAIVAGVLLIATTTAGLLRFTPLLFVLSIGGVLGGVAFFGSTRATRQEMISKIRARETQRSEMIDRLELRDST